MKKTLILAAALTAFVVVPAFAVTSGPTSCPAGYTRHAHSGSGRGGGYHTTYTCDANPCTTPWGTSVASGGSYTAFQSASVTAPAVCVSETVTCSLGQLSPNLGYANSTCSAVSVSPGGGTGGGAVGDGPND